MKRLLEESRKLSRLLQRSAREKVEVSEITDVLTAAMNCNSYILDRKGQVLGRTMISGFRCDVLDQQLGDNGTPAEMNEWLMSIWETRVYTPAMGQHCPLSTSAECKQEAMQHVIIPVGGGGQRLGTLIMARPKDEFLDNDLVLGEYAATVAGMMFYIERSERMEEDARKRAAVQIATSTLSYSEIEALQHIFEELGGEEGLLVASKIADEVGITRSVIVNALRKLESAGVLESRSLGMKGTYIRVLNDLLIDEVKKAH